MDGSTLRQVFENFRNVVAAKSLLFTKWQFKCRALKMADEDMDVIGIDQSLLRRLTKKVFRMIDDILVQWSARCHQHGYRHSTSTPGPAYSLPCRSNGSRISRQDGDIQASDVDAQFQRVRRYDA